MPDKKRGCFIAVRHCHDGRRPRELNGLCVIFAQSSEDGYASACGNPSCISQQCASIPAQLLPPAVVASIVAETEVERAMLIMQCGAPEYLGGWPELGASWP